MKSFRHVLVPLDHEAPSREALEYAVAVATRFGSEIGILRGDCDARDFGGDTTVVLVTSDRVPALAETLRVSEASARTPRWHAAARHHGGRSRSRDRNPGGRPRALTSS